MINVTGDEVLISPAFKPVSSICKRLHTHLVVEEQDKASETVVQYPDSRKSKRGLHATTGSRYDKT